MMKAKAWRQSISALAVVAISTASAGVATAEMQSLQIAQSASPSAAPAGSIVGQTRCAKQSTAIFADRAATSAVVRALATNQSVTLSENAAQGGFIGVSAPVPGFVQTVNLKVCPTTGGNPSGNPGGNPGGSNALCRLVRAQQGLLVRRGPSVTSAYAGSVAGNSKVYVTKNPPNSRTESDGRIWIEINQPIAGWVSNGFTNTPGSNLAYCQ